MDEKPRVSSRGPKIRENTRRTRARVVGNFAANCARPLAGMHAYSTHPPHASCSRTPLSRDAVCVVHTNEIFHKGGSAAGRPWRPWRLLITTATAINPRDARAAETGSPWEPRFTARLEINFSPGISRAIGDVGVAINDAPFFAACNFPRRIAVQCNSAGSRPRWPERSKVSCARGR